MKKYLLSVLLSLSAGLLTAGGSREPELKPVDVFRQPILVDLPDTSSGPAQLAVRFGAGQLDIGLGTRRALASGEALYNNELFTPTTRTEGQKIILSAGDGRLELREFIDSWSKVKDHLNRWELQLAPVPMELELDLGASSTRLELGGVPVRRLRLSQGRGRPTSPWTSTGPTQSKWRS